MKEQYSVFRGLAKTNFGGTFADMAELPATSCVAKFTKEKSGHVFCIVSVHRQCFNVWQVGNRNSITVYNYIPIFNGIEIHQAHDMKESYIDRKYIHDDNVLEDIGILLMNKVRTINQIVRKERV